MQWQQAKRDWTARSLIYLLLNYLVVWRGRHTHDNLYSSDSCRWWVPFTPFQWSSLIVGRSASGISTVMSVESYIVLARGKYYSKIWCADRQWPGQTKAEIWASSSIHFCPCGSDLHRALIGRLCLNCMSGRSSGPIGNEETGASVVCVCVLGSMDARFFNSSQFGKSFMRFVVLRYVPRITNLFRRDGGKPPENRAMISTGFCAD
jgi:hypothetical protein